MFVEKFEKFFSTLLNKVTNIKMWSDLSITLVQITLIWIAGEILLKLCSALIIRAIRIKAKTKWGTSTITSTERTLEKLLLSTSKYVIRITVVLFSLSSLGVNMTPFLTGAGIIGIAIGFGTQNFVRDIISGFFIIFERQFAVGDMVKINTFEGIVKEIGLRTTILKSENNDKFIIPNGNITSVINMSNPSTTIISEEGNK